MSWFKVDDKLDFHVKTLRAGNEGMGAWVRMGAWSSGHGTDGFVPKEVALMIAGKDSVIKKLIDAKARPEGVGLLEVVSADAYRLHDFLVYNPASEAVQADRDRLTRQRSEAGKASASRRNRSSGGRWGTNDNTNEPLVETPTTDQHSTNEPLDSPFTNAPTPSRPVPSRPLLPPQPPSGGQVAAGPPEATSGPVRIGARAELLDALLAVPKLADAGVGDLNDLARGLDALQTTLLVRPDRVVAAAKMAGVILTTENVDPPRRVAWMRKTATRLMRHGQLEKELGQRPGDSEESDEQYEVNRRRVLLAKSRETGT